MDDKLRFQQMMQELIKQVEKNGKEATAEDVQAYLGEMDLSEEQTKMVLEYVQVKQEEKKLSQEEEEFLAEYLETVSFIKEEGASERNALYEQVSHGNVVARERLIELYLREIVDIAKEMKKPGVFIGDLVQEGNLGLTIGVSMIQTAEHAHEIIMEQVKEGILTYIEENTEATQRDKEIIQKVSKLDESISKLEKEFGRKVIIDELAEEMKLSEDEVLDILKLAGENLDNKEEES